MTCSIKATIPTFEELTDSDGKIYTVYNVFVEEKKTSMRWLLRKRYSAFQALHAALKDQYPEIVEPFRFPHKSMFNTFSNYTKERRRQGFDDFLKLLVSLDPLPTEVARFLELDDHVWPHAATLPQQNQENASGAGNGAAGNRKPTTAGASGSTSPTASSFSAAGANSSASASSASLSASSADGQTRSGEVKTPLTGKDVLKTMKTTFIATTVLYTVSIVLGIFDVKKSSAGQMLLTVLLLGSCFTLIRIILLKKEHKLKKEKAK